MELSQSCQGVQSDTMRIKIAFAGLITAVLSAISMGQHMPVDIGANAPYIHSGAWIKGTPVAEFQKGQVYAVVFWLFEYGQPTDWLEPFGELEGRMQGKVQFIGVDTGMHFREATAERLDLYRERAAKYVKSHESFMPASVCLDDEKFSVAKQWLPGEEFHGIPTAVIVNQQGQVAWVGRPAEMDVPLRRVLRGAFDINAFREKFHANVASAAVEHQLIQDVKNAAKAGDPILFDGLIDKLIGIRTQNVIFAISLAAPVNPEFALSYLKTRLDKDKDVRRVQWCNALSSIAANAQSAATKDEAVRVSAERLVNCPDYDLASVEALHARVLTSAGRRDEALSFIEKAKVDLAKIHPLSYRADIERVVDNVAKGIR